MSVFKKLKEQTIGTAEEQLHDFTGGVGFISEAGIYSLKINRAWGMMSKNGAIGIHIEFGGEGMAEQDLWMTNQAGETFYINQKGKPQNMAGYIMAKKVNYIATGDFAGAIADIRSESKIVKTKELKEVNGEWKKVEVEKEVDFISSWQDKEIMVAFQKVEALDKDKKPVKDKDGNQIYNLEIINVYNTDGLSASESYTGKTEAEAINKDRKRLEENPIRKSKVKSTSGGTSGTASKKPNPFG